MKAKSEKKPIKKNKPVKRKDGRGRPKLNIDLDLVRSLGEIQCTLDELAIVLGIWKGTLSHRQDVLDAWEAGKASGKMSLRRMQFAMADKNAAMAIWLGKQCLDQKDKQEIESKNETSIVWKEEKTYQNPNMFDIKEEDEKEDKEKNKA